MKGPAAEAASDEKLNRRLTKLQSALDQAMEAVQTVIPAAEKKVVECTEDEISCIPPELARKLAERIKAAAEVGDVLKIASIANELKSENRSLIPFCDKIIHLSDDFDLDGILNLANELSEYQRIIL